MKSQEYMKELATLLPASAAGRLSAYHDIHLFDNRALFEPITEKKRRSPCNYSCTGVNLKYWTSKKTFIKTFKGRPLEIIERIVKALEKAQQRLTKDRLESEQLVAKWTAGLHPATVSVICPNFLGLVTLPTQIQAQFESGVVYVELYTNKIIINLQRSRSQELMLLLCQLMSSTR